MTSRAQMPLVRGRSHSENFIFSQLCCVNKCETKKERQTTKQKEHRNIASLSLQLRSYNKKKSSEQNNAYIFEKKRTKLFILKVKNQKHSQQIAGIDAKKNLHVV